MARLFRRATVILAIEFDPGTRSVCIPQEYTPTVLRD
ncbi:MAG: hypothetical protein RL598_2013 [Verrucomicrobiota bacterium]|jgi:hypothetical protein